MQPKEVATGESPQPELNSLESYDQPLSSYTSNSGDYAIENLEVTSRAENSPLPAQYQATQPLVKQHGSPHSSRRALFISLFITVLVIIITAGSAALFIPDNSGKQNPSFAVPTQDIEITVVPQLDVEISGDQASLLVKGDVLTRGKLVISNNGFLGSIESAGLTGNHTYTLPDGSGVICLDNGNCDYASDAELDALQGQVNGLTTTTTNNTADITNLQNQLGTLQGTVANLPNIPNSFVTAINNQTDDVTIQGSTNRVIVTTNNGVITLSTPQAIGPTSTPTFGGLTISGTLRLSNLDCTPNVNGGTLTTDASGNILCADDDSGASSSVTSLNGLNNALTLNGTAGQLSITDNGSDTITLALNANVSLLGQTIGTPELEDSSVTSTKIADGTITGTDIATNTISETNLTISNAETLNYVLASDGAGGFTWVAQTVDTDTDTQLSEAQVEAYIFDADNTGTLSSGTLALGSLSFTGSLNDLYVSDTLTIGASSTVADGALSANVSLLGQSIGLSELEADSVNSSKIVDASISEADLTISNTETINYVLASDGSGGFFWVPQTVDTDTDTQLSEAQVEAYIFDADNTGTLSSGTIALGSVGFTGTLSDTYVSDSLTIDATGSVDDGALSANVTLLGTTITKDELTGTGLLGFTWGDSEISDTLTIGASSTVADGALSVNVSLLGQTIENGEITDGTIGEVDLAISNAETLNYVLASDGAGGFTWVAQTVDTDTDTQLSEAQVEAYIFDADNTGTLSSGTLALGSLSFTGSLNDLYVSDTLTIGASSTVADGALSSNVSLLGQTIGLAELESDAVNSSKVVDGSLSEGDLNISNVETLNYVLASDGAGGFTWVAQTVDTDTDTTLTEAQVEAYIFDADNTGVLESGTLALGSLSFTGTLGDLYVADDLTISATGSVDDGALSANVTLLGATITKDELTGTGLLGFTWSDSEINDTLTIGASSTVADGALSVNVSLLGQTIESSEVTDGTLQAIDFESTNVAGAGTEDYILSYDNTTGGFTWVAQTVDTDTTLTEAQVEAYIFDADNTGTLSSGTLALGSLSFTGTLGDLYVADDLTISASGNVADGALSANVSLLGQNIDTAEILNGTITAPDISFTNTADGTTDAFVVTYDNTTGGFTLVSQGDIANSGTAGVTSVNGLNDALTLQGTAAQITISDNGTDTITLALDASVSLLGQTIGTAELEDSSVNSVKISNGSINAVDIETTNVAGAGTDGYVLTYDNTTGGFTLVAQSTVAGASGIDGSGATNQIAFFSDTDTIQGSTSFIYDGTNVTLGGGDFTAEQAIYIGTSTVQGNLALNDGNGGHTTTLRAGNSSVNLTFTLPTANASSNNQCLKGSTGGVLSFSNCNNGSGAGGAVTMQDTYDASGTPATIISTSNTKDIIFRSGVGFNSSTFFQVQNASGQTVVTADTTGGRFVLGQSSSLNGSLVFNNAVNGFGVTLNASNQTVGSATFSFPDTAGANDTVCLEILGNCEGTDTVLTEAQVEGYIFDADNTGTLSSGTLALGALSYTGTLTDVYVADDLTVSASGSVADGALSVNVSLLGQTIESSEITNGTIAEADLSISNAETLNYVLASDGAGGFTWVAQTADTDTQLTEAQVEAYIFDADNTGTLASGTIALDSVSYTGTLDDLNVNDALTISASGSVADGALSANVSLLGQTIGTAELEDGSVTSAKIGDGSIQAIDLESTNVAGVGTDTYVLTYDNTTGGFTYVSQTDIANAGTSGVSSLNTLDGALTLQGTASKITVSSNGTDTLTLDLDASVSLLGQTIGLAELEADSVNSSKVVNGSIAEADLSISNAETLNYVLASDGAGGFTWVAQTVDTNTTYTAGNDLDLSGTTFNIESQLDFVSTVNQTGANLTFQTTTSGNIVLNSAGTIELQDNTNITGSLVASGDGAFSGGSLTLGTAAVQGNLILNDSTGQTATIQLGNITANTVLALPAGLSAADNFCFETLGNCSGSATTLQASYDADVDGSDALITLTSTDGALRIRNSSGGMSGALFAVESNNGATKYIEVSDVASGGTRGTVSLNDGLANFYESGSQYFINIATGFTISGIGSADGTFSAGHNAIVRTQDNSGTHGVVLQEGSNINLATFKLGTATFGNGVTNSSPSSYLLQATGGSGTNVTGANLTIAGGRGTGLGAGGDIVFQTANQGIAGSTLNPLIERMRITDDGDIGINTTNAVSKLHIVSDNTATANHSLTIDTDNEPEDYAIRVRASADPTTATDADTVFLVTGTGTGDANVLINGGANDTAAGQLQVFGKASALGELTVVIDSHNESDDYILNLRSGVDPTALSNADSKFLVTGQGHVGIGDTSPAYALTVGNGDLFGVTSTGNLVWEGTTADANELTITVADPTADRTYTIPNSTAGTDTFCLLTLANCAGGTTYDGTDFIVNGTAIQTGNYNIQSAAAGSVTAKIQGHASQTANILEVGDTFSGFGLVVDAAGDVFAKENLYVNNDLTVTGISNLDGPVVVAANQSLRLTGGTTASRPGSPTEGMLFYDTDTNRLLTYTGGKWQSTGGEYTIVAASNSPQAIRDAADYVTDGDNVPGAGTIDGDQVQINAALTAAAGGKVYLAQGTYVADATILIPNNTTLAGAGKGTLIELADIDATDNLVENNDFNTGVGIAIRDLQLSGREDLNTLGTQNGIYLDGNYTNGAADSNTISNVIVKNFRNTGVYTNAVYLLVIENSTISDNDTGIFTNEIYNGGGAKIHGNRIEGNTTFGFTNGTVGFGEFLDSSFNDNYVTGNGVGILVRYGDNSVINNNVITGNIGTGAQFSTENYGMTFSGNAVYGNGSHGVHVSSGSVGYSVFSSNSITANTGKGIFIEGNAWQLNITGNSINGGTDGIYLNADSNANAGSHLISGNSLMAHSQNGIVVTDSSAVVTGNKIHNIGGANAFDGIRIANDDADVNYPSNSVIRDNTITDTAGTGYAINIPESTTLNTYLADNTYSGTGASSINDAGTGTIYGGQVDASGNYDLQPSGSISLLKNTDITGNLTVSGTSTFTGNGSFNGNLAIGNANTDTLTINAGTSGAGITLADSSFFNCTALETSAAGVLTCGTDDTGGGGVSDLQGAYDGGNTIVLASNNAVRIQDNATPITGNLIEVTSNGAGTNFFSVSAITTAVGNNLTVTGDGTINGNTTLGDAGSDTLTVAATSTFSASVTVNSTQTINTSSTTAFKVNNATSGEVLNVDTTNSQVTVNGQNQEDITGWTGTTALPQARQDAASAVYNGYIYTTGGSTGVFNSPGTGMSRAKINPDGSFGSWSTDFMLGARQEHVTVAYNGYLYVISGNSSDAGFTPNAQSNVWVAKINPEDGNVGAGMRTLTSIPGARRLARGLAYNGYIYVVGGNNGSATQSTVYYAKVLSDGTLGTWGTTTAGLPAARQSHDVVVANGRLYVIGGFNGSAQTSVYFATIGGDGNITGWTTATNSLPAARADHASFVQNGYIYVTGGGSSGATNTVYYSKINSSTGQPGAWASSTTMPVSVLGHNVETYNGFVYLLGGSYTTNSYYGSGPRTKIAGTLDLTTIGGSDIMSANGMAGVLSAGDTNVLGDLRVTQTSMFLGDANFANDVIIDSPDAQLLVVNKASGGEVIPFKVHNDTSTDGSKVAIDFGVSALYHFTNARLGVERGASGRGDFYFQNYSGSALVETMRIQSDGDLAVDTDTLFVDAVNNRVGIGDGTPDYKMEITGTSGSGYFGITNSTDGDILTINSSGNVGIGDTAPLEALSIMRETADTHIRMENYGGRSGIVALAANGTEATPTALEAGESMFVLQARGYGATGFSSTSRVNIELEANQAWTDTAQGTRIIFSTTANDSTTTTERFRIAHDGNIGIGDTTPDYKLEVQGSSASGYFGITNSADGDIFSINSGGDAIFGNNLTINGSVTVAAQQTITLVGATTALRPVSPTEGMLFYDTDTNRLLTYTGGKWQSTGGEYTIVAASNSPQAIRDAADYVTDGDNVPGAGTIDGDQVQINAALTAAAGGKVYLAQGTYVADATILIPNNTTLAGAGKGTLIELADIDATDNLIENTDATTGTGVAIRNLSINGRKDLNTVGTQNGIYLTEVGDVTTERAGAIIEDVGITSFRNAGVRLQSSDNSIVKSVYVTDVDNSGIYLSASNNNVIESSISSGNAEVGILVNGGSNNNAVSNNITSSNLLDGIFVGSNSNSNTVTGNTVSNNAPYGIRIYQSTDNNITGNTVTNTGNTGIYLWEATKNNITGNTVTNNASTGMWILDSSNNNISSNSFHDNGGAANNFAIYLDNADSNSITNNAITDTSATTSNNAITFTSTTSENNYFAGNTLGGGIISGASTGSIYGGQLTGVNGSMRFTNDVFEFNGTSKFSGNLVQTGHGVNGLGDQESMVANSGFEIDVDSNTFVADGWTFVNTTGIPTFSTTTTSPIQGDRMQQIAATSAQVGTILSGCVPITGGQTYNVAVSHKSNVSVTSAVNLGLSRYTTKANCTANTSPTTTNAVAGAATNTTTNHALGSVATTSGQTWARVIIQLDTPSATVTTSFDSVRMIPNSISTMGIDIAENFPVQSGDNLQPGELVSLGSAAPAGGSYVIRSSGAYDRNAMGVVTTQPGMTLDDGEDYDKAAVALTGRVPVKVNGENGAIEIGDPITASSVPGVGMKATQAGRIIGTAVTAFNGEGEGTITVLINPEFYAPPMSDSLQGNTLSAENLQITGTADIADLNVSGLATINELVVTGSATVTTLTVTGNANILGDLVIDGNVAIGGDVQVKGRVYSYGEAPKIEIAPALGSLGEAAITGTDTAGSVVFKAVAGLTETLEAGEAIHVSFTGEYDYEPRVQVTPTSEHAAALEFYVQRDATGFKIVFTKPLEPGKEYRFDYFIVGADATP